MTTSNFFQWGNGPRDISTRQQFAAVIRDITGIDTWYPVRYKHEKYEAKHLRIIENFKIASEWIESMGKYGYYWKVRYDSGTIVYRGNADHDPIYSDYWTACTNLAKYLGCTDQEINDIFWNGKDRSEVGCPMCPCNRVEAEGKR